MEFSKRWNQAWAADELVLLFLCLKAFMPDEQLEFQYSNLWNIKFRMKFDVEAEVATWATALAKLRDKWFDP
jgi:hypothetical protein